MMDDAQTAAPRRQWPSDFWRIGFVMLLALCSRGWNIAHTEVISRDGISFIRYALQLEEPPMSAGENPHPMTRAEVLKASFHPPGYSTSVLGVSWVVRPLVPDLCDAMRLSAQIASLLASLLLVVPMYFLGKLVFDRQTAFVATMLFQVLPVSTQVASDGLSDNLFLCLMTISMWLAALGCRRQHAGWFLAAGVGVGLTYLVRPEGLILVPAVGCVMLLSKLRGEMTWKTLLACSGGLVVGTLLLTAPYMATIGRVTNKPTGDQLFHWLGGEKIKPSWIVTWGENRSPDFPLAIWFNDFGLGKTPDELWATKALAQEAFKASFYVLPFFALIGAFITWPRVRRDPAGLLIVGVGFLHSMLLWRMAKGAGYVAERHTLLVVLCSSYFAAAAVPFVGEKLALLPGLRRIGSARCWSIAIAIALAASCVPASMKTLHQNRVGHREVGRWIGAHPEPDSFVLDPFAWAEYYAGNVRLPSKIDVTQKTVLIVTEGPGNEHPRLHVMQFANYLAARGQVVYHWPESVPREKAKVIVTRWHGDDLPQQWENAIWDYAQRKSKAEHK